MALIKAVALPSGFSAEYFRMTAFIWDRSTREASAHFALFKDATVAQAGQPVVPVAAKLRLKDYEFDAYLSPTALAAANDDVIGQLYAAAKALSQDYATAQAAGEPFLKASHVVSDFGRDVFAGAVDA